MRGGDERRAEILAVLKAAESPVSGTALAAKFGVSRQVIVQDIALLRAENQGIVSSYKGYILTGGERDAKSKPCMRVFHVHHGTEDTLRELQTIVDCGGRVLDVFVEHALYGEIRADLMVRNRADAAAFEAQMKQCPDGPLNSLTGGGHYHTVSAETEDDLNRVEEALRRGGFLLEQ